MGYTMLAEVIRAERSKRKMSQRELATLAGVSRKHLSDLESGANVSLRVITQVASALSLKEIAIGATTLSLQDEHRVVNTALVRDRAEKIIKSATDVLQEVAGRDVPQGARVLAFRDQPPRPRITFAEEGVHLDELRRAFANSPDAEFRKPFKGRKKYVVPRGIDAAAGAGAELLTPVEEEEQLREIPEHYWEERGARMVLRARGNSLILRGIVDRDLLFVRPTASPKNGDIIACRVNNQALVKIFEKKADRIRLCSANPKFGDIDVDASDSFHCFGVVVGRSGYGLKETEDTK
jgi:SOS-response transcriptional repressor LexA/DNA-binding XRE family transcriptional regulator